VIYVLNHPGNLPAALEVALPVFATDIVIRRFAPSVMEAAGAGGVLTLRVQDASGATPAEFIQTTITAPALLGAPASGTVGVPTGSSAYLRIVSNTGTPGASFLSGFFEYDALIAGTPLAGDLTSLAAVKLYAGITGTGDDALIQTVLSAVSEAIHRVLRYRASEVVRTLELYSGHGVTDALLLRHRPAGTLVAVQIDAVAQDLTDFLLDAEAGILYRTEGVAWPRGRRNIGVSYTSGYAPGVIPGDLGMAAVKQTVYELGLSKVRGDRIGEDSAVNPDGSTTSYVVADWITGVRDVLARHANVE